MTIEIVFETHSLSTDNEAGIATGWHQGELSEEGRRLARRLGERRGRERIDAVYTSDLRRAIETAELAFGDIGILIRRDARLRECDYGTLNGGPASEVERESACDGSKSPFRTGRATRKRSSGWAPFSPTSPRGTTRVG
jgi:broad specificity phosphatase PhoE